MPPGAADWELRRAPGRLGRPWVAKGTLPNQGWKTMISRELLSPIILYQRRENVGDGQSPIRFLTSVALAPMVAKVTDSA